MNTNKNIDRLTYFSPTSFRLPSEMYTILEMDALHFGFKKNHKANICGFLNELLPALCAYKIDLRNKVLSTLDENIETLNNFEKLLNTLTLAQNSLLKQNYVTVPFRVSAKHYNDFIYIHDYLLSTLNVDFSSFVRSILFDYISKRLAIRERLFLYKQLKILLPAIENRQFCHFFLRDQQLSFLPHTIIVSPYTGSNILFGINRTKKYAVSFNISLINNIIPKETQPPLSNVEKSILQIRLNAFFEEEKKKRQAD